MPFDRDLVERIREATDIKEVVEQHVRLIPRRSDYVGICPFHQDSNPSMHVVPSKGIYHCFACGASGDVFRFLMNLQGISFPEVLQELAQRAGIATDDHRLTQEEQQKYRERQGLRDLLAAATEFFEETLWVRPEGTRGRAYMRKRNIANEILREARVGYAPEGWTALLDYLHRKGFSPEQAEQVGLAKPRSTEGGYYDAFRDRIIFPIMDRSKHVIGFGGRLIEGEGPKYINTPETAFYSKSKVLYGLQNALPELKRKDRALLVEGYFDVLALHQAGYREAVATCGTALTAQHIKDLRALVPRIYLLTDADSAGEAAASKALPLLADHNLQGFRVSLPDAKDPDEFLQRHSPEEFEGVLRDSAPLLEWKVGYLLKKVGTNDIAKQQVLLELDPILRFVKDDQMRRIARALRMAPEEVDRAVRQARENHQESALPAGAVHLSPESQEDRWAQTLLWLLIHHPSEVLKPLLLVNADLFEPLPHLALIAALLSETSVRELVGNGRLPPGEVKLLSSLAVHRPAPAFPGEAPTAEQLVEYQRALAETWIPAERALAAVCDVLKKLTKAGVDALDSAMKAETDEALQRGDREALRHALTRSQALTRRYQAFLKLPPETCIRELVRPISSWIGEQG